jgi:hypothetical protein
MIVSARSYVAAGIAVLTAGVIALPTTIEPLASPTSLSASARKEQVALLAAARSFTAPIPQPVAFVVLPPQHPGTPTMAPNAVPNAVIKAAPTATIAAAAPAALAGFPGIQNAIINAYNAVNPWVDYGVNLAQYAVGWIPVASFFAPQIGIVYYSLIDPIVTSAVYNTAYVLGGSIGIIQGISNVINDSINAGIGFVNAEINWALSFLPPLPPLPFAAAQTTALKVAAESTAQGTTETADPTVADKHQPTPATPAEPAAKPATDPTAPEAPKNPTQPATETSTNTATPKPEAEPVATKPETEPVKKPESTSTDSSSGVAAQGDVRGGTQSATDTKKPDDKTPASNPDTAKPDAGKGDKDTTSTTSKPSESSPSASKTGEASKTGDADKDAGKTKA